MDPTGPSQPPLNTAYDHPSNPAESTPSEHIKSTSQSASAQRSAPTHDTRSPHDVPDPSQTHATPSSLGYGVQDSSHDKGEAMGPEASNTEGEAMRVLGEGEVARAQETKGGFGEQGDLASGLDRKKEEQTELKRDLGYQVGDGGEVGEGGAGGGREEGVDVGSVLGGKGFVGAKRETGREGAEGRQGDHTHV